MQTLSLSPLDQAWLIVTGCFVFLMQAGFLCVEAGISRAKHSFNVSLKNLIDFVIASLVFLFVGYGFMFGETWRGLLGTSDFLLMGLGPEQGISGHAAFLFFQLMFCGTAATIVSGAMAERMKFKAYLIYSVFVSAIFYPLFGHWVWGGSFLVEQQGWLARLGYLDFAGSSVVHQMGGWLALAGIIILGPRQGKFDSQGRPQQLIGHNIPLAFCGVFILWFGWFGFNGGSTLHMNNEVGLIIINTNTGAAAGALAAMALSWALFRRPDVFHIMNGVLGGMVAITASAAYVRPGSAILIGAVAGLLVVWAAGWLETRWKLDDVVGAVSVHGFCGLWGIVAAALFSEPRFLLHPDNRFYHLGVQLTGSAVCFLVAFGGGWILFWCMHRAFGIRVSSAHEKVGLNLSEHHVQSNIQELADVMLSISQERNWGRRAEVDTFSDAGQIGEQFNALLATIEMTVERLSHKEKTSQKALDALNQSHQDLKRAQEHLVQAEKMGAVGRLASGVAHEVKNPLGIIIQGLTFMKREITQSDVEGKKYDEIIVLMEDAVWRADRIVRGLLDFSRPASQHLSAEKMDHLVLKALELVRQQPDSQKIEVFNEFASDVTPVEMDKNQMTQVLINIIQNAFHAMPKGGRLTIRCYMSTMKEAGQRVGQRIDDALSLGQRVVVCQVEDTGGGITPENQTKIFDPFFTTKGPAKGTGLGLSVSRQIVENHLGLLTFVSTLGVGTTFTIALPADTKTQVLPHPETK